MTVLAVALAGGSAPAADTPTCVDGATPTLQPLCPALPSTNAKGTVSGNILDYDIWAWNSFIAMNWPALNPKDNNNQRGFPDLSQRFDQATDALTVWETLKEKREIFLADPQTREPVPNPAPQEWNAAPQYGPAKQPVPCCTGFNCATEYSREMHGAKLNSAFDTDDETAEVASEARETNTALCAGYPSTCATQIAPQGKAVGPRVWRGEPTHTNPVVYEVKVNWDFFNYVQQFGGGTRVPTNQPPPSAKYFYPNALWVQPNAVAASAVGEIRLPARTSAKPSATPPTSGNPANPHQPKTRPGSTKLGFNPSVHSYSASDALTYFGTVTSTTDKTPYPSGSVHLKAAWMELKKATDNPADYHTAQGFTFAKDSTTGLTCKMPSAKPQGLVGLHIIQRIHETAAPNNAGTNPRGGTFVFATWEHRGNDSQRFTYANLFPTTSDNPDPYPNVNSVPALHLNRVYDIPATAMAANEQVWTALNCPQAYGSGPYGTGNGTSVWCNYMLVGVQYKAVDTPMTTTTPHTPPTLIDSLEDPSLPIDGETSTPPVVVDGQNYYLANLVIESNVGLQQFQGLPPNQTPINHYAQPQAPPGGSGTVGTTYPFTDTGSAYDHTVPNIAFRIAPDSTGTQSAGGSITPVGSINMGGCMGCHGVAQLNGYAFSFVLLGNQTGAAPDTQDTVDIPPPAPTLNYAVTGTNGSLYIASSKSGDAGSFNFAGAGSGASNGSPALASFGGKLYYAVTGTNGSLYIASSATGAPGSFTFQFADNGSGKTNGSPALAVFDDKLYYAVTGLGGSLYIASSATGDPGSFSFAVADGGGGKSNGSPALAALGDRLYYAVTGTGGSLYIASSATGDPGSFSFEVAGSGATNGSPALAEFGNKLYYAVTGTSSGLYIASSATGNPGSFSFAGAGAGASNGSPALAEFEGRLYYAVTGTSGGALFIASSATGDPGSFTFESAGSGATNGSPALAGN